MMDNSQPNGEVFVRLATKHDLSSSAHHDELSTEFLQNLETNSLRKGIVLAVDPEETTVDDIKIFAIEHLQLTDVAEMIASVGTEILSGCELISKLIGRGVLQKMSGKYYMEYILVPAPLNKSARQKSASQQMNAFSLGFAEANGRPTRKRLRSVQRGPAPQIPFLSEPTFSHNAEPLPNPIPESMAPKNVTGTGNTFFARMVPAKTNVANPTSVPNIMRLNANLPVPATNHTPDKHHPVSAGMPLTGPDICHRSNVTIDDLALASQLVDGHHKVVITFEDNDGNSQTVTVENGNM